MMSSFTKYINKAKKLGAKDAKIIPAKSIVTAEWVRLKCQFGCGGYAGRLTCPPHSPTPEQTRKVVSEYKHALLIHGDEYTDVNEIVADLEREIFLDGYYKAYGMGAGPCSLCERCTKRCRYPDRARPSMEASGIDVYATVHAHGFRLEVTKTRRSREDYYGVILIE
jgi:predicted metal-binding protein